MTQNFTFDGVPSIIVENGATERLAETLSARFSVSKIMIVSDPGIAKLGLMEPAIASLKKAGKTVIVFTDVEADPSEATLKKAAAIAMAEQVELIIGFGGGSSMDVAKLVAILACGEQELSGMYGVGNVRSSRLPLVMVPTTAGTGSEVTPISVITTGATTKMGVSDRALYADMAVLDAKLTVGLPRHATAATGIDAMVHAIEACTSRIKKNPVSDALAKTALVMLGENLLPACEDGSDIEARSAMLTGAMIAGQAFANAPVGAVHALAYPLGGYFHIPHGHANALVLPYVLKFNADAAAPLYAELADVVGLAGSNVQEKTRMFISWLENLSAKTGIETRLRDMKIKQSDLPMLAKDAMQQTRLLMNNPVDVSEDQALKIYEAAW
ncbi:iron-containing alcohol dehydrogenase [Kordiimonas aquimaris]|uniref:iron-containing alcohol dehydrogenase n=1 Tax=Kordiimonas aquimaris TaxID=707591 RepID=UPI0021CE3022|nr:iron-containing alcohol dehydrogenase [Kordiimonas aquimaris]